MTMMTRRIHSTLTEVAEAAAAAEALCIEAGADESQALRIGLALDELAANALVHGALNERAPFIEIRLWMEDDFLNLTIEAEGPRFDPRQPPPPPPDSSYSIGGRGLSLVLTFADGIKYRRVDGRNVTTFSVRKFGDGEELDV